MTVCFPGTSARSDLSNSVRLIGWAWATATPDVSIPKNIKSADRTFAVVLNPVIIGVLLSSTEPGESITSIGPFAEPDLRQATTRLPSDMPSRRFPKPRTVEPMPSGCRMKLYPYHHEIY